MKFQCLNPECKKTFLYTAKQISTNQTTADVFETHVCPYCHGLDFEELIETVPIEKISSVKSVELDKVDEMIGQGYEVKELYAKTATMIKKALSLSPLKGTLEEA
jgi:excinuclease UvrABC ATPase subunit